MTQSRTRRGGATCVAVTRGELKAVEEFKYVGSVLTSNSSEWIDVRRLPNADVMKPECVHHSFIHSVLCLTTRPFLFQSVFYRECDVVLPLSTCSMFLFP